MIISCEEEIGVLLTPLTGLIGFWCYVMQHDQFRELIFASFRSVHVIII